MSKNYNDDRTLLEELKKHNEDAYKFFYLSSRARLFVLAYSIVENEEAARDLLQEFYTDFWQDKLYENVTLSLKAYIYTAIKNRAIVHKKRMQAYSKALDSLSLLQTAETPKHFENQELKEQIYTAIRKLPPMAGMVFTMHYINKLSHEEIAAQLKIARSTVANHIHRALTELRSELKKKSYGD